MVDTDIGLRNLDVVLGLENRIVYNLVDVVEGNCRMKQALIRDKRYEQLYLLPSAQTRDKTSVTPEQMKKLCDELKQSFDFVLLDCPAGIEQGFANAVAGANKAIVVTTPEVSAIRDADRIIGLLEAQDLRDISLVINRIRPDMVKRGEMMSVDDVQEILAVPLLGILPDDEQVVIANNQGEAIAGSGSDVLPLKDWTDVLLQRGRSAAFCLKINPYQFPPIARIRGGKIPFCCQDPSREHSPRGSCG